MHWRVERLRWPRWWRCELDWEQMSEGRTKTRETGAAAIDIGGTLAKKVVYWRPLNPPRELPPFLHKERSAAYCDPHFHASLSPSESIIVSSLPSLSLSCPPTVCAAHTLSLTVCDCCRSTVRRAAIPQVLHNRRTKLCRIPQGFAHPTNTAAPQQQLSHSSTVVPLVRQGQQQQRCMRSTGWARSST